jgi:hypothetical protein
MPVKKRASFTATILVLVLVLDGVLVDPNLVVLNQMHTTVANSVFSLQAR